MSVKITDLVEQETIDKIAELNGRIQEALVTYQTAARDMAKGLEIDVRIAGDLDKIEQLLVSKTREAVAAQNQLRDAIAQQRDVIGQTTPVISRNLMEKERMNKLMREEYNDGAKVKELLSEVVESYDNNARILAKLDLQIKANKESQKQLEQQYRKNQITEDAYIERQSKLIAVGRDLSQQKSNLQQVMKIEEKMNLENESSYNHLSHQLELLKKTYKELTEAQRGTETGMAMERSIQELDAHLKELAADMGEFQRNVGNYAIAGQNGVVSTDSLNAVLERQAVTMQDVADQTKILEEAKRMLDTSDEHYAETLAAINDRIDENKAKLTDVSDIMERQASSAAEAEAQNKRLQEAMKHIDLSADDAQERIDRLNAKIEQNNELIDKAAPSSEKLARKQKELAESAKKAEQEEKKLNAELERTNKESEDLASQMLSLVGVNDKFASSIMNLKTGGSVLDGLGIKVKAFGKTLMGLLSNPWVLTFLGIAGAGAVFKWWYDYNKGLMEASRLTENFTGLTGEAADKVTNDCMVMADRMGKGFDQTIGAANTLVQQFGLSWGEALQMIQDGIVAGADMSGNMVENIDKFAGSFRDAGVEADQFMAILAETRNGIFDEKALKSIADAGSRIRSMSKSAEDSLEAIGISAKQMQSDLANGNMTMLEAIQQVTDKMGELPPNCQEVGDVMKNVFGRKAAMAGEEVLKSISGINDNLEVAKERMGELGKVNEEQLNAQKELQETLSAVFKMSGTSFEVMTTKAKTLVAQGLNLIIKGCVDIVNRFINIYNKSAYVRVQLESLIGVFKVIWSVAKNTLSNIGSMFSGLGSILEGVLTVDPELISKGAETIKKGYKDAAVNIADDFTDAFRKAKENIQNGHINEISVKLKPEEEPADGRQDKAASGYAPSGHESDEDKKAREKAAKEAEKAAKEAEKAAKEAEKAAKEELKRIQELEDSKIAMMADGHEKELALIRQKFKKRIDAITGGGETENALRLQLTEQCMMEISECEIKYQKELSRINLENRLASVRKGSREELDIRLAQLEAQRGQEIESAEKTGADVGLINEKYNARRMELEEKYTSDLAKEIEDRYAGEEVKRNEEYSNSVNALKQRYVEELKAAKGNAAEQERLKKKLDDDLYALDVQYSRDSAQAAIDMIEEILNLSEMSAEDRLMWERKLTEAKIDLYNQDVDAAVKAAEEQTDADNKLREKRIANAQAWLQAASDVIGEIGSLVDTLFESRISKIEAEQEANQEAGDKEQERISELVSKNVITEEEGEARKRAAAAQTQRKEEELEKKKAKLKYKQAVWDKAATVAQIGISTALAIMNASQTKPFLPLGLAMTAAAATMGAIQLATALATPIPKYAKGTDRHSGGPAIVGDGGRQEVVLFRGEAWLTPDRPTLMDIPEGAKVIPDIRDFDISNFNSINAGAGMFRQSPVVVNNDYSKLQQDVREVAMLIRRQTKAQQQMAYDRQFEIFRRSIL